MKHVIVISCGIFLTSTLIKAAPYVDFDASMRKGSVEYAKKVRKSQYNQRAIAYLKTLYQKNDPRKMPPSKDPKIPKIRHAIWVGGKPLPKIYKELNKGWKKLNPDWQHMIWTDKQVKKLKLRNQAAYDKTKDPVEKANILRYELLYKYGGLYVDMDSQCLKSFTDLHHLYTFYTGICPLDCDAILNNAVIACTPGHPIMDACIKGIPARMRLGDRLHRTGVFHFSHVFLKWAPITGGQIIALPPSYFYPLNRDFHRASRKHLKPESYAVHYWNQMHDNKITKIDV